MTPTPISLSYKDYGIGERREIDSNRGGGQRRENCCGKKGAREEGA